MSQSPSTNPLGGNPLRTRADAQQAVRDLFEPLVPHYAKGGGRVHLGDTAAMYDVAAEGVEAFARSLWAIVPLTAGGGEFDHWDIVRAGLVGGTDPEHPQYWGAVGTAPGVDSSTDQRMVEMAAIGLALALVPEEFFDPLTDEQKANVLAWLSAINETEIRDNNWQFFRVLVNLGFERVGGPTDWEAAERSLITLESNHLGDGWYQDGSMLKNTDFYVAFAFHFYGLIYARLAEGRDPDRAARFRGRAERFAPDWAARFDVSGRVIAYGRSMTYRFAGAGFFGALAFADVEGLPWGTARGLWAKHLRWWAEQDITDERGVLSIGWGYGNLLMSESYNAPGSPYWALKAFLPLALPETHPFWATPEDADAGAGDLHLSQPHARCVVQRTPTQTQMLNAGRGLWFPRHGTAKYGKLAYSSAFPFALEPDDLFTSATAESTLAFLDESGVRRETRRDVLDAGVAGDIAWATWEVFDGDVRVHTVMAGEGSAHARLHAVETTRRVTAIEGGFAIENRYDPATSEDVREEQGGPGRASRARVANGAAESVVLDPTGRRQAVVRDLQPNTSILWRRATAPMLTAALDPGRHVLVTGVAAHEESATPTIAETLYRSPQLWERLDALLGEPVERPEWS